MINKFKDIARRGLSLALALSMMIPTGVYAATEADNKWDKYKDELINGLIEQKEIITIDFGEKEIFTTEETAQKKVSNMYEDAINEVPKIYGKINIEEGKGTPKIVKISGDSYRLEEVVLEIEYYNNIKSIKTYLNPIITEIKVQDTAYGKIKGVYDYILENMEYEIGSNHKILDGLKSSEDNKVSVSADGYAMLFSIMMDEIGYDNVIVVGTIKKTPVRHVWNLVKVQGNWFHVDASLGEAVYDDADKKYNYFLTSDDEMETNHIHKWEIGEDKAADEIYNSENSLVYEKEFIKAGIEKAILELEVIENDFKAAKDNILSLEEIKVIENRLDSINTKIVGFRNSISVLEGITSTSNIKELNDSLETLTTKVVNVKNSITTFKDVVEKAIEAVDKAVATITREDLEDARELMNDLLAIAIKGNLESRLVVVGKCVEAKEAVEAAESILVDANVSSDNLVNGAVNNSNKDALEAKALVETLDDNDIKIKNELLNRIVEIIKVKTAKDKIVVAEKDGGVTTENIDAAKNAVIQIKYNNIKENFESRILKLETKLKEAEESEVINKVNYVQEILDTILEEKWPVKWELEEWTLKSVIELAEASIKTAEAAIKTIEDTSVKVAQQNRIKDFKIVLTAIKAVDKAESTPKATNAKSARTAIEKIIKQDYDDLKDALHNIVDKVEEGIKATEAESYVKKAEISLKRTDYEKAKEAVEKISNINLSNRINDVLNIILAKEAVENAEALMKANKATVDDYKVAILAANNYYNNANNKYENDSNKEKEYKDKYGDLLTNLFDRIGAMNNALVAIIQVGNAEASYDAYLKGDLGETKLNSDIELAKNSTNRIDDNNANLKNIKKSLQSRLKVLTDKIATENAYNDISNRLKTIESKLISTELIKTGNDLDTAITSLESEVTSIEKDSKSIKNSSINDRITAIKNVIAATKAVVAVENSDVSTITKNIKAANTAVFKLSANGIYKEIKGKDGEENLKDVGEFKVVLQNRINTKKEEIDKLTNETIAISLVEKAITSKKEKDIKAAIEAVAKLKDDTVTGTKSDLNKKIKYEIVDQLVTDTNNSIVKTILSIELDDKSVTKNVTEVNNAVSLVQNIVLFADSKLLTTDGIDYRTEYHNILENLNESKKIIVLSQDALKAVQQAEKTRKQGDYDIADTAIKQIPDESEEPKKYENIKKELERRLGVIYAILKGEKEIKEAAESVVKNAEGAIYLDEEKNIVVNEEFYELILLAEDAVDVVSDKSLKSKLQDRIKAVQIAKEAIDAVANVVKYPNEDYIKDAEKALKAIKGKYSTLIPKLREGIEDARAELNESKSTAYREAENALNEALEEIIGKKEIINGEEVIIPSINDDISKIKDAEDEKKAIDEVNSRIIKAEDLLRKAENKALITDKNEQKNLQMRINQIKESLILARDDLYVEDAWRLVRESSTFVNEAISNKTDEYAKENANNAIKLAKLAISKIGDSKERRILDSKKVLSNELTDVEARLASDSDKELIAAAESAVYNAAKMLSDAVRNGDFESKKASISGAITSARLAIIPISDENRDVKDTLNDRLDELYKELKAQETIKTNEELIKEAKAAVEEAEAKRGTDELQDAIWKARMKIDMIKSNSDTKSIINTLHARLDALEGKGSGDSGSDDSGGKPGNGGNKPGGNNGGSNKPGGTSPINKIPTSPIPDSKRKIGTSEPNWGRTKELKKANPVTGVSYQDMSALMIYDSMKRATELSNILNTTSNPKVGLVVRGKNVKIDTKPYIHDKINDSVLVPIKSVGDELGYTVSLTDNPAIYGAKRLIINGFVNGLNKSIIMDIGSEYSYVNGYMVKNSSKPIIQNGRAYIPIDFIVEHLGANFNYYNDRGNIQLIIN